MNKDDVLRLLRSSRSGHVSGAVLAAEMGVSRTAVWKHIKTLEREGYSIEAVPSKGYRLTASPDVIVASDVKQGLGTRTIGKEILHHAEIASTNTLAMDLAQKGAVDGTVVIAETQTGGKGRLGRTWISPRRQPVRERHPPAGSSDIQGAAHHAHGSGGRCLRRSGSSARSRPGSSGRTTSSSPERRSSGLLTEMSAEPDRIRHIVLGIGVNVNMDAQGASARCPKDVHDACCRHGKTGGQDRPFEDPACRARSSGITGFFRTMRTCLTRGKS